jgi:hypothetical protein
MFSVGSCEQSRSSSVNILDQALGNMTCAVSEVMWVQLRQKSALILRLTPRRQKTALEIICEGKMLVAVKVCFARIIAILKNSLRTFDR